MLNEKKNIPLYPAIEYLQVGKYLTKALFQNKLNFQPFT